MYTKLVENHQTGFSVRLFWRSPCPVSHPPPIPVRGRHGPVRARGTEGLPHSLCLLPSPLQRTDNEARESAMSLWLFCSQETGWSQAPSCLSQGMPVTKVTPLAVTLLQPLPDGSAFSALIPITLPAGLFKWVPRPLFWV